MEDNFKKNLVREYLKHESVDEVFKIHKFNLPISYSGYQRVLDKWGIIKSVGPNSKISETLSFLYLLSKERIPLERLYKKIPINFETSIPTLHRIVNYVKKGIIRRYATAIIITKNGNKNSILVGEDISTPKLSLGKKYGAISLPMGFSKKDESNKDSILRVLQKEVFTNLAVEKNIPNIIPFDPRPFMQIDAADIRLSVYLIKLPKNLSNKKSFSSYKLINFDFINIKKIKNENNLRAGINEIINYYTDFLYGKKKVFSQKANINKKLTLTYLGLNSNH